MFNKAASDLNTKGVINLKKYSRYLVDMTSYILKDLTHYYYFIGICIFYGLNQIMTNDMDNVLFCHCTGLLISNMMPL